MENFKSFQLSSEEAANTLGQRKGKRRRAKFIADLTDEQKAAFKEGMQALRESEGWDELSRDERKAARQDLKDSILGE